MKKLLVLILALIVSSVIAFPVSAVVPNPDSVQVKCANGIHYGQLVGVSCGMSGFSECTQSSPSVCGTHDSCETRTLYGATYVECMNCHHIFRSTTATHGCGRLHTQYGIDIAIDSICPYGWSGPTAFPVIN